LYKVLDTAHQSFGLSTTAGIVYNYLTLGHSPTIGSTIDHINRNPFDNCRFNLRIATSQIQMINQTPQRGTIQPGVKFYGNYCIASWTDENGVRRNRKFNVNKFGHDVAKTKSNR